jgi:hypothetical protein
MIQPPLFDRREAAGAMTDRQRHEYQRYEKVRILDEHGNATGRTATVAGWWGLDEQKHDLWAVRLDDTMKDEVLPARRLQRMNVAG